MLVSTEINLNLYKLHYHIVAITMCMQLIVLLIVMMVNYVLLVDQLRMKAEWRFAMRISGEQCVVACRQLGFETLGKLNSTSYPL